MINAQTLGEILLESVKGKVFIEEGTGYLYEVTGYSESERMMQLCITYGSGEKYAAGASYLGNALASQEQARKYHATRDKILKLAQEHRRENATGITLAMLICSVPDKKD